MRRLILTAALVAPPAALLLFLAGAKLSALVVFLAAGVLLMTPVLLPNVQWLGPVMTHFDTAAREIWLTIDDGPADDTGAILELLRAQGVTATFFVKGSLASTEVIERLTRAGHTVGNHSMTHPSAWFWCLLPAALAREIDGCARSIPATRLFRAPVGMKNPFVHPLLEKRGMQLVGFSARAYDAVVRDPQRIATAIAKQLEPGAIVVLHQGRRWSLATIEATIAAARERGYSFVVPDAGRLKTKR